jgi:phosphatidate phosphatase APP1
MVKAKPNAHVQLVWQNTTIKAVTAADGFFHFQWKPEAPTDAGWHEIRVDHTAANGHTVLASAVGSLYIPHRTQYGCISDIDDTFLISHSRRLGKRLFVLFTHNARTRKPFAGVVEHYRMLSYAGSHEDTPNPFFYVSSSEWNLFNYIAEFTRTHKLPHGVYLLSQLKHWYQLLKTGQNKHGTKFTRISRILESYPDMRFVLLGDDTQEDPDIYNAISKHFGKQIICVYLRNVRKQSRPHVQAVVKEIEARGIYCCYFEHSEEAIAHSNEIGLTEKKVDV